MKRAGIRLGIDRDGLDAHLPRGADDAASDLATIGDQDFLEHGIAAHKGMLSCFFGGFASFLSRSMASERITRRRVERGWITSSI